MSKHPNTLFTKNAEDIDDFVWHNTYSGRKDIFNATKYRIEKDIRAQQTSLNIIPRPICAAFTIDKTPTNDRIYDTQSQSQYGGRWCLPKGKMPIGWNYYATAIEEFKQETFIDLDYEYAINSGNLMYNSSVAFEEHNDVLYIFFAINIVTEIQPDIKKLRLENREIESAKWQHIEYEIPDDDIQNGILNTLNLPSIFAKTRNQLTQEHHELRTKFHSKRFKRVTCGIVLYASSTQTFLMIKERWTNAFSKIIHAIQMNPAHFDPNVFSKLKVRLSIEELKLFQQGNFNKLDRHKFIPVNWKKEYNDDEGILNWKKYALYNFNTFVDAF